jgi:hypothetical protein
VRPLAEFFHSPPLPRWRAIFAITCAAAAFLSAGGMMEYGAGSPEAQGSAAATYWALLFGLHVLAFGGAGLLAAFPALARAPIKLTWVASVALVYGLAFMAWHAHRPDGGGALSEWLARWRAYLPAAVAVIVGLLLAPLSSEST